MRIDVDAEFLQVGEHRDGVVQVALRVSVDCLRGSWPGTSNSCTNHGTKTSMLKRLVNGSKPRTLLLAMSLVSIKQERKFRETPLSVISRLCFLLAGP